MKKRLVRQYYLRDADDDFHVCLWKRRRHGQSGSRDQPAVTRLVQRLWKRRGVRRLGRGWKA